MEKKKKSALQQGVMVFIGLAVLTAVEYGISLIEFSTIALFVVSLMKAGLIMNYFMHVSSLWSQEGGNH
jgi:cytochrome c oxidase subunit IV